jgi:hypothetical protein
VNLITTNKKIAHKEYSCSFDDIDNGMASGVHGFTN